MTSFASGPISQPPVQTGGLLLPVVNFKDVSTYLGTLLHSVSDLVFGCGSNHFLRSSYLGTYGSSLPKAGDCTGIYL